MNGRSQVPPTQALYNMSMDELILSFNAAIGGQGSVEGTASFWSQQIMHKQQSERQERAGYALELDPAYCDVAVRRWEDYTGLKAERLAP